MENLNKYTIVVIAVSIVLSNSIPIIHTEAAPTNSIVPKDSIGNEINPSLNHEVFFTYDIANSYSYDRNFNVQLFIIFEDGNEQLFYEKRQLKIKADKAETITWNFIPEKTGNYLTKIVVDDISTSYTFIIRDSQTDINSNRNSTLSPLKQFKSGIRAEDVTCKQDLQLIIKAKDGSPACVKPASITKLVAWGWAKPVS